MSVHRCEPRNELATERYLRLLLALRGDVDRQAVETVLADLVACPTKACLVQALIGQSGFAAAFVDNHAPDAVMGIEIALSVVQGQLGQQDSGG